MEPNTNQPANQPVTPTNPISPITPPPAEPRPPQPPQPQTFQPVPPTVVQPTNPTPPPANDAPAQPPTFTSSPVPPAPASPGIVVGSDAPPAVPGAPVGPVVGSTDPLAPPPKRSGLPKWAKPAGIAAAALVLLFGVYTFAYKNNPSVIYSQSLKNTGKGYDRLVKYVDNESQAKYKGYTGSGSYKVSGAGASSDGNISLKASGDNAELKFDVGLGASRVNADLITIASQSKTPDLYLKVNGVKGLGNLLLGSPELDQALNKLDNSWVAVDHTLIDNLTSADGAAKPPTREQMLDEAKAFGKVNKDYLFSTKKDKAVLKLVKKVGKEKVEGHSTYHYVLAINKDNYIKYIDAQQKALKASKLQSWIKAGKYEEASDGYFDELKLGARNIKASDTFDMWADNSRMIIYKIRLAEDKNKATDYLDIGLDYKGGGKYPFFLAGKNGAGGDNVSYKFVAAIDTKTHGASLDFKLDTGADSATNVTMNFTYKPTDEVFKITKPSKARPLAEVLNELGLGSLLNEAQGGVLGGSQAKARNSKRMADLSSLQTQLEAFYAMNGYYPSLGDMNSSSWLSANMKGLDRNALIDPSNPSQSTMLVGSPVAKAYAYQPTTAAGASCEGNDKACAKYTLTATYEGTVNGQATYVKSNLD